MRKIFKNIHKWLSIPLGIFITLICLTGATLIFEKEITDLVNRDLHYVDSAVEDVRPLSELVETAAATLPDSVKVTGVTVYSDPLRAYQVNLSKPRQAALYIDQYTGEVKGIETRLGFFNTMMSLHRWLLCKPAGGMSIGKLIVGIATIALVFILITGILMWLTNRKKPLTQSLKICANKGMPRFWHDLHVAGGIYVTIFVLAMALTGLTWSFSWYRTGFYALCGVEQQAGGEGRGNHGGEGKGEAFAKNREGRGNHGGDKGEAFAKNGEGRGNREGGESRGNHEWRGNHEGGEGRGNHGGVARENNAENNGKDSAEVMTEKPEVKHESTINPYLSWQIMLESIQYAVPNYQQLTVSDGKVAALPAGRTNLRATDDYNFDRFGVVVTSIDRYSEKPKAAKLHGTIYSIHTGSWGGIITRIIYFFAALLGATLPLTGYYLWLRKRAARRNAANN